MEKSIIYQEYFETPKLGDEDLNDDLFDRLNKIIDFELSKREISSPTNQLQVLLLSSAKKTQLIINFIIEMTTLYQEVLQKAQLIAIDIEKTPS
jgi:hypothetical protein